MKISRTGGYITTGYYKSLNVRRLNPEEFEDQYFDD